MTNEKTADPSLQILVVEDESLVAMMIEDMLEDLGHKVIATSGRMPDASRLVSNAGADLAILDVNLTARKPIRSPFPLPKGKYLSSSRRATELPESRRNGRGCRFCRSRFSPGNWPRRSISQFENDEALCSCPLGRFR
jgi:CheY-like chemotaxis protein